MTLHHPPGPAEPAPPAADVDVWVADLDAAGWPTPERLPEPERARAARFRDPVTARRWTASRWALREVLGRYLDEVPAAIPILSADHGKPRLAIRPERLDFNLSHSTARALVAVAIGTVVGVDIERIEPRRDLLALARHGLDSATAARLAAAEEETRAELFYAAWTAHEARLKCLGAGLGGEVPSSPVTVSPLDLGDGYAGAVAVGGRTPRRVRIYSIAPS